MSLMGSGCATMAWYGQAAQGQLDLLCRREPIVDLINDPSTDPELRRRLETVLEIRAFASEQLGLPDSRSYTHYADLEREAAVWNVIAAPELEMRARSWCYPLVGCLAYRGYFRHDRARAYADRLRQRGYDVAVSPAAAYSTLGWFADPVLNTMLVRDDAGLAGLIFHELTHEKLFVSGDTEFNEAYATAVEREGVRRWLRARQDEAQLERWEQQQRQSSGFVEILLEYRRQLAELYASDLPESRMKRDKATIFEDMRASIRTLGERHGTDRFTPWLARDLNNAHLVLVATYEAGVVAFEQVLDHCDGDLVCFHGQVARMAAESFETRQEFLRRRH
jgi:predicted aminopeptidase